jgi:NAD(P)H-dependent FMN reductase
VKAFNQGRATPLEVEVVDPIDYPSCMTLTTNGGNPTYYAAKDPTSTGEDLAKLVNLVKKADCFLIVTPEYNHSLPPALTATMNHVGCSLYANKCSGCVCYSGFSSAGGGARVSVALRPYLSELGCLPVSKQVIVSDANKALSEQGEWIGDHKDGAAKTMATMLGQVAWWAEAAKARRAGDAK